MLRAWHNEPFCTPDLAVKARDARRSVVRNNIAPELGPKADDEVHSSCGGPWFTDSGDCGHELLALLWVQNVKLQIRMGGRPKSEDSSLRRVHAGIIAGTILANPTELDRVTTAAFAEVLTTSALMITDGRLPDVSEPEVIHRPFDGPLPLVRFKGKTCRIARISDDSCSKCSPISPQGFPACEIWTHLDRSSGDGPKTSDTGMFRLDFPTLRALKLAPWADQMPDNSLASA